MIYFRDDSNADTIQVIYLYNLNFNIIIIDYALLKNHI